MFLLYHNPLVFFEWLRRSGWVSDPLRGSWQSLLVHLLPGLSPWQPGYFGHLRSHLGLLLLRKVPPVTISSHTQEALLQSPLLQTVSPAVLVRLSIVVKRFHDRGNSYKGKYCIGAGLQFRGCHHGGKQADTMLER